MVDNIRVDLLRGDRTIAVTSNPQIQAMIGRNYVSRTNVSMQRAMVELATGYKVNSAKDDAVGLSISDRLRMQLRGNTQVKNNSQEAINLLDTAENGVSLVSSNIERIRDLCVQLSNDVYSSESKQMFLNEIKTRLEDIDRVASSTNFQGKKLLDGSADTLYIQTGARGDKKTTGKLLNATDISSALPDVSTTTLGINLDIGKLGEAGKINGENWTTDDINNYIDKLDTALSEITKDRAAIGGYMRMMESKADLLTTVNMSIEDADSRIMDADIAESSSEMVRCQILQQTSTSVLAQANQVPYTALQLLFQ